MEPGHRSASADALGKSLVPALAGPLLIVAGVLFLRKEGLGRPAATIGGLTLALGMAGSAVVLTMPFAATLAWTALALGGAAGFLHARGAVRVLAWLALTALALSQVAAAHFTNGLLIALLEVSTYVLLRSILQVKRGERSLRAAFVIGVGLFASLPLLAAAVWV